jgi:hypothetical protein
MKPYALTLVLGMVLVLALMGGLAVAQPNGSDGAGRAFGEHHAWHAQEMGFSGEMNPGMHQGFAGFHEHHMH